MEASEQVEVASEEAEEVKLKVDFSSSRTSSPESDRAQEPSSRKTEIQQASMVSPEEAAEDSYVTTG